MWSQLNEAQVLSSTDVQRGFIMFSYDFGFYYSWMDITVQT